jgi:hypothetical protein
MSRLGAGLPALGLEKASLKPTAQGFGGTALKFKYNPEQFSISTRTDWTNNGIKREEDWEEPNYNSTSPVQLELTIFLDAYEELFGDITGDVKKLMSWTKPDSTGWPPLLEFLWGDSEALQGMIFYLESVSANYTLFRMNGTPIRATCSVTLVEYSNPAANQNPTSGGTAGMESHVLIRGETLHSVAWQRYGKASYWRAIADYNGIDDPMRLEPGMRLLLPPQRQAAALS